MHLQTLRPRESSFDKYIPPAKRLFLDTNINSTAAKQPQYQQREPRSQPGADVKAPWYECASYSDVQDAVAVGVAASQILFTSPKTSPAPLRLAARLGVNTIAVDGVDDLLKVRSYHPQAKVVLRINAGDMAPPTTAFDYAIEMMNDLLEEAASLKLPVVGVNFCVNSSDLAACSKAIESTPALQEKVLEVERRLELIGVSADLVSNTCPSRDQTSTPESPLAFPDFNEMRFAHSAFALVS